MHSSRPLFTEFFLFIPFHRDYLHGFMHVNVAHRVVSVPSIIFTFLSARHRVAVSKCWRKHPPSIPAGGTLMVFVIKYSVFNSCLVWLRGSTRTRKIIYFESKHERLVVFFFFYIKESKISAGSAFTGHR